jgi:hypothetical protein
MKFKLNLKIIASILSVTGIITAIGFGCGLAFQPVGEYDLSSTGGGIIPGLGGGGLNDVVVIAGKQTVMVPRGDNIYKSLLSQLQIKTPNAATIAEYERQKGSFSESGSASSINASFTFAAISLSAAVCLNRIIMEQTATDPDRLFFNGIDFNGNVSQLTDEVLGKTINRLARANWGRDETAAERAVLIGTATGATAGGVRQSIALDTDNGNNNVGPKTREAMLYLCTAIASSVSGYQL